MSKLNDIQSRILSLSPGKYQKLLDCYLIKKFKYSNIHPLGSHDGTDKTTRGTPDSFVQCDDGKFILIAYGSVISNSYAKVEEDIKACLDESKTHIKIEDISQIICCHTSTNFNPGQVKTLSSLFANVKIIGLGELSYDLFLNYPSLASEFLDIPLDTHQIFKKADFILEAEKNQFSTPLDMPILCRDQEIDAVCGLAKDNPVVIIQGASGSGKTRLALSVADRFNEEKNYEIRIIKSNKENIYDDLKSTFIDDTAYFIIVDDADQLTQLHHLVDICLDHTRTHDFKILITVRDYAKEKIYNDVTKKTKANIYDLKSLTKEDISKVLKECLNIKNDEFIKHICDLAKGNVRLAVMAAKIAIEDVTAIQNAFDIFNHYYSDLISQMDQKEILCAALIAFFDKFKIVEDSVIMEVFKEGGISRDLLLEYCDKLHKKEIISIFDGDDRAVKFENQNLRDYLLYYIFFKEKTIALSYMIEKYFFVYRSKIIFAFTTLIRLFYSKENKDYLEEQVKKSWYRIKDYADDDVIKFVESFHSIIPDESLAFLKKQIDKQEDSFIDLFSYDFKKNSHYHTINSEIIKVLISFKETEHFREAIELALYYFKKHQQFPMDMYFMFGEYLGYSRDSHKDRYLKETMLINKLYESLLETPDDTIIFSTLFATNYLLGLNFSQSEAEGSRKIVVYNFELIACDEIYQIRKKCFDILYVLFQNPKFKQKAHDVLLKSVDVFADKNQEIIRNDVLSISSIFKFNGHIFEDCMILDKLQSLCDELGEEYIELFPKIENKSFMAYKTLTKNYYLETKDRDDREQEKKNAIINVYKDFKIEVFNDLWKALTILKDRNSGMNGWSISEGINMLFDGHKDLCCKFASLLDSYIAYDMPFFQGGYDIFKKMVDELGYDQALDFIESKDFSPKPLCLSLLFDIVPTEMINKEFAQKTLSHITEGQKEYVYMIRFKTAVKINEIVDNYVIEYLTRLYDYSLERKSYQNISTFLNYMTLADGDELSEYLKLFSQNKELLKKAYIMASYGQGHFDYSGVLFLALVNEDPMFIDRFIKDFLDISQRNSDLDCLNVLWNHDNYIKLITIAMDAIKKYNKGLLSWNTMAEELLVSKSNDIQMQERQKEWVFDYIKNRNKDMESMVFLFYILCNLSKKQFKEAMILFCQNNTSFDDFCKIPLTPMHEVFSNSEIPQLEAKIKMLYSVKEALSGMEYIEHRERIASEIYALERRKRTVLMQEFLDD
ncbi:MAG: hypothetical protein IJE62_07480 [Clostridia bacterium]|nr:hypothetical protein [Clostridia bacterium]MBQ7095575.1 hypothetical protein [Clostridia bacterium]